MLPIFGAFPANAVESQSDWMNEELIVEKSNNNYTNDKCVYETRKITLNYTYFYANEDAKAKSWCVYHYDGFDIAFYQRKFTSVFYEAIDVFNLHATTESGMAIAFDNGDMTPVNDINYNFMWRLLYIKNARSMLYENNCRMSSCEISQLIFSKDGFTINPGTGVYDFTWRSEPLRYSGGDVILAAGYSVSESGEWAAFIVPNMGLMRINNITHEMDLLRSGGEYAVPSYLGSYEPTIAISNDGRYTLVVGRYINNIIEYTSGCSSEVSQFHELTRSSVTSCPVRGVASSLTEVMPLSGIDNSVLNITDAYISGDNRHIWMADGGNSWYDMYTASAKAELGKMSYLALGDSFASGEGDMAPDGAHYISGTNVYGNAPFGIPREMCHISDRSYPMLLGKVNSLSQANGMYSVACSGAVTDDVFKNNQYASYIRSDYLGQPTQTMIGGMGSSRPRLEGIENASALQADAREKYIPGRVQQIELAKKMQPKVITLMMGGNDVGYADVMTQCAKTFRFLVVGAHCKYTKPEGMQQIANTISTKYDDWVNMYKAIKDVSPSSKLYIIGYPKFFDVSSPCNDMMNLYSKEERTVMSAFISYLNAMVKTAANNTGATYIDISDVLVGKELCGKSTAMTSVDDLIVAKIYTEHMKAQNSQKNFELDHKILSKLPASDELFLSLYSAGRVVSMVTGFAYSPNTAIMGAAQQLSHPNEIGHAAMAQAILSGLGETGLESSVCGGNVYCPTGTQQPKPSVASFIDIDSYAEQKVYSEKATIAIGVGSDWAAQVEWGIFRQGNRYLVKIGARDVTNMDIKSVERGFLHSDPIDLGNFTLSDGYYVLSGTLSKDIPVGIHTLVIDAINKYGEPVKLVRDVMVEGPISDIDGDGVPNENDSCAFGVTTNVDVDNDDIDDACDTNIIKSDGNQDNNIYSVTVERAAMLLPAKKENALFPILATSQSTTMKTDSSLLGVTDGDRSNDSRVVRVNQPDSVSMEKWGTPNTLHMVLSSVAVIILLVFAKKIIK